MKPPLWSLFLALLLPAALLLWVGEYLSRPAPWNPSEEVRVMEKTAAKGPYDVVVIGPSSASTDIHGPGLGRLLGKGFSRVGVMSQGGSTAPAWYAILKERVYKNGLRPKLVIVNGIMQGVVKTRMDARERGSVLVHTAEPDGVLLKKSWGSDQPAMVQRAMERRGELRSPVFSTFRLFFPGLYLDDGVGDAVDASGVAVFGTQHREVDRVLPGVETDAGGLVRSWEDSNPEDSYLSDIAALAHENGAAVVLVLAPVLQSKVRQYHQLSPEAEGRLIQHLNQQHVGLVDLRNAPIGDAAFVDGVHMNRTGQKLFTELLAESLIGLGVTKGELQASVEPLIPVGVERLGEGPAIGVGNEVAGKERCSRSLGLPGLEILGARALKLAGSQLLAPLKVVQDGVPLVPVERGMKKSDCAGTWILLHDRLVLSDQKEGAPTTVSWNTDIPIEQGSGAPQYWVLPGTTLRWRFDKRWGVAGPYQVEVSAVSAGSGAAGSLRVGEAERTFASVLDRWEAELEVDPKGAWDLDIQSPEDGSFLLIRSLVLSYGSQRLELIRDGRPAPWSLLGVAVTAPLAPSLPVVPVQTEGEWSFLEAPWPNVAGCSPLVVLEDGQELPRVKLDNWGAKAPFAEGVAHLGKKLYFHAKEGKEYTLAYGEDRHCWSNRFRVPDHLWIYPGDRLSLDVNQVLTARVAGALRRLEVRARANEPVPPDTMLDITFLVNDRLHFHTSLPAADLSYTTPLLLDPPLLRERDMDVRLELRLSPGSPPLFMTLMGWEG